MLQATLHETHCLRARVFVQKASYNKSYACSQLLTIFSNDSFGDVAGDIGVVVELHAGAGPALGGRT